MIKKEKQPNILWICTDQQRWNTLGCYGNENAKTPNLDKLAENGTIFDTAFCQSPVCTPSRVSFLTGRYPRTARGRQNGQNIPKEEVLVTRLLHDAGYYGGLSGKLHISSVDKSVVSTCETRINDGYDEFYWSHHHWNDWGTENNKYLKHLEEIGGSPAETPIEGSKHVKFGPKDEWHQTTWCCNTASDFMRRRADTNQPWFFSVNIFDPHHPFNPPEEYLKPYLDDLDEIPLPCDLENAENKKSYLRHREEGTFGHPAAPEAVGMSNKEHRLLRASYLAMCNHIDTNVGRMIKTLEETGQLDNTIIIFSSDHGELLGDHGLYLKGGYFYDEAIRVPLIVSYPEVVKSQRSSALVELTDIAQTILDACGVPHHEGMQGKSFWDLLTTGENKDEHRDDVYCEFYNALADAKTTTPFLTMVRNKKYKLTVDHPRNTGELYDLINDEHETTDLWDNAKFANIKTEMLLSLCNRMAFTADPMPRRLAAH